MLTDLLLIVLLGPIGIIIVIFRHLSDKKKSVISEQDIVSQSFFLLSVFFFGVTLLAFNRDLGDIVSWRTILFVTSLAAVAIAYYFDVIYTVAFTIIALPIWWGAQAVEWIKPFVGSEGKVIKSSALLAGLAFIALLFYIVGRLHEKEFRYKHFARLYSLFGILFVSGILFILSTKLGLSLLENMTKGISLFGSWQIALSLFIFTLSLVGLLFYGLNKKMISLYEVFVVAFFVILFGIIAFLSKQEFFINKGSYDFFGGELSGAGILWAIAFNIVVFFELLGIIFSGYARREEWLINLGAIFLFLLIVVKYFDWFFTSLDKSMFFIGAGILLLGVGWFMERGRRYVISMIKPETAL